MKTAIFVEGQTELIFVREYLLKKFDYQDIQLECYNLHTDSDFRPTAYAFGSDSANHYFQIMNVGNDDSVLTRLLNREQYLWNSGFNCIIGLRDMYSRRYREMAKEAGKIDLELNEAFKQSTQEQIVKKAKKPQQIGFVFAIMETESWILGLYRCFEKINSLLTVAYIEQQLGFNLETTDPETSFFHPAKTIEEIYGLANENYDKKEGTIAAIMATLEKDDFEFLANANKCASFGEFVSLLK
ncbi:MAG TPA: hypothetical protein PKH93_11735 [Chitinophagales bacterium]|jgi:hypothetical protein|nr:hypothetical protein [Chitinophagales bacterium]